MSGQLEVHHSALCTAPVSLNLCCCGPYPEPGHSPWEAATLRPILLWQLHSTRSNAKHYCVVYMVTLYFCLYQQGDCVSAKPGRAGGEKWHSGKTVKRKIMCEVTEDETMKEKKNTIYELQRLIPTYPLPYHLKNLHFFHSNIGGSLQILVFVFVRAAARGDGVGGLLLLLVFFRLQGFAEELEDGSETHPGGQLMSLCAFGTWETTNTKVVAYCLLQGWKSASWLL